MVSMGVDNTAVIGATQAIKIDQNRSNLAQATISGIEKADEEARKAAIDGSIESVRHVTCATTKDVISKQIGHGTAVPSQN
jgi:hypothetical protein